jgi:hypothetical protein
MTNENKNKYNVKTLAEAQTLLPIKADELEKFFEKIVSYVDELPSLEEIETFQKTLRAHEQDVFVLRKSLKNIQDESNEWKNVYADCEKQYSEISRFEIKLADQKQEAVQESEKNKINLAVLLFNASVPPSAAAVIAKLAGLSDRFALYVAGIVMAIGIRDQIKIGTRKAWNAAANIIAGKRNQKPATPISSDRSTEATEEPKAPTPTTIDDNGTPPQP